MEKRFPESESENRGDSVNRYGRMDMTKITDRGYRSKERKKI